MTWREHSCGIRATVTIREAAAARGPQLWNQGHCYHQRGSSNLGPTVVEPGPLLPSERQQQLRGQQLWNQGHCYHQRGSSNLGPTVVEPGPVLPSERQQQLGAHSCGIRATVTSRETATTKGPQLWNQGHCYHQRGSSNLGPTVVESGPLLPAERLQQLRAHSCGTKATVTIREAAATWAPQLWNQGHCYHQRDSSN